MENYLLVLYVSLEQEQAIKNLFSQNDWLFTKPDVTDKFDVVTAALDSLSKRAKLLVDHVVEAKADVPGGVTDDVRREVTNSGVDHDNDAADSSPDENNKLHHVHVVNKESELGKINLGNGDGAGTMKIRKKKSLPKVKIKHSQSMGPKNKDKDQNAASLKKESNMIKHKKEIDGKCMVNCKSANVKGKRQTKVTVTGMRRTKRRGKPDSGAICDGAADADSSVDNVAEYGFSNRVRKRSTDSVENIAEAINHADKHDINTSEMNMDESNTYGHDGGQQGHEDELDNKQYSDNIKEFENVANGRDTLSLNNMNSEDKITGIRPDNNTEKQELSCTKCRKKFKSFVIYRKHQVIDRCQLICPYCGKNFRNRYTSFKRHLQFVHTKVNLATSVVRIGDDIPMISVEPHDNEPEKEKEAKDASIIECSDCHLTFEQKHIYEKHRSLGKCRSECPYCEKVFINNYHYFQMHIRRKHTKERPYVCSACGTGFVNISLLNIHEREHAGETFPCNICGIVFPKQAQMFSHRKMHSPQSPWLCDLCGGEFGNAARLRFHKARVHSDARPFSCIVCSRRFKDKYDLTKHSVTHSDIKKHKCSMCDKSFKLRQGLTIHERRHNQDYRHFCSHCNKGFIQKGRLTEHMRIHLNEKPFQCPHCSYKCTSNSNLKKHLNVHLPNRAGRRNQHRQNHVPKSQNVQNSTDMENYPINEIQKLPDTLHVPVPIVSYDQSESQKLSNYQLLMSEDPKGPLASYQMAEDAKVQQHYYLTLDDSTKIQESYNLNVMPVQVQQNINNATSSNIPMTLTSMNVNDLSSYVKIPSMSMTGDDKQAHYVIPQHML